MMMAHQQETTALGKSVKLGVSPLSFIRAGSAIFWQKALSKTRSKLSCHTQLSYGQQIARWWLVVEAEPDPTKAPPTKTVARAYRFVSDAILNIGLNATGRAFGVYPRISNTKGPDVIDGCCPDVAFGYENQRIIAAMEHSVTEDRRITLGDTL
jgi:hypothetical protein